MQHEKQSCGANLIDYFRSCDDVPAAESAVLDAIMCDIVFSGKKVTSKAIILYLIAELESTSDVVELNVLRSALEIVVSRTPDDEGV